MVPEQTERGTHDVRSAAVLVLLSESGPDVVLTERSATLRSHPRQISFPGGGLEPGENAVEAALREAREEVGLDTKSVRVLGAMPPALLNASSFDVTAVLGTWDGAGTVAVVDPGEVAAVHRVAMEELADPGVRQHAEQVVKDTGLIDALVGLSKCPDYVVNRGHEFGAALSPADKEALIAYLLRL